MAGLLMGYVVLCVTVFMVLVTLVSSLVDSLLMYTCLVRKYARGQEDRPVPAQKKAIVVAVDSIGLLFAVISSLIHLGLGDVVVLEHGHALEQVLVFEDLSALFMVSVIFTSDFMPLSKFFWSKITKILVLLMVSAMLIEGSMSQKPLGLYPWHLPMIWQQISHVVGL